MKKLVIIITFLFVLPMTAQKEKAIIHFKDGTTLTGMAKIITSGARIKFRQEKKSKYKVYTSEEVESIELYKKESISNIVYAHYYFKKTKTNVLPRLLELKEDGKIKLYLHYTEIASGSHLGNGMTTNSISKYYVSKDDDELVTHLGDRGNLFSKNFKKAASKYFQDCPELVKKIENKEFKKRDIEEAVNFYNHECES